MAQLDPSRYRLLSGTFRYGTSDGLYYDSTNGTLVLALGDSIVDVITATGSTADLEVSSEARGDMLRRGASAWERHSAKTSGQILVGDGTDVVSVAVSGDATLSSAGAVAVTDLSLASEARGDIARRGATVWAAHSAKAAGQVLLGDGTDVISTALSGDIDAVSSAGVVRLSEEGIAQRAFSEDFNALDTVDQVSIILPSGLAASGATGVMNHLYSPSGKVYCIASLGAGQTLFPSVVAAGLDIGGDQTDDEGWEIFSHFAGATGRPFIVGRDAAFYFTCKIVFGNADGLDHLMVGLRRAGPHLATPGDIQDYATFGVSTAADPMAVKLLTGLGGTDTETDTTQTMVGTTAVQFKILVSAAGVVTFQHDIVTPGTLAAPTATVALTLDDGDPMIPFVRFLNVAAFATSVTIHSWDAGYQ
jgi:hypothetical protein